MAIEQAEKGGGCPSATLCSPRFESRSVASVMALLTVQGQHLGAGSLHDTDNFAPSHALFVPTDRVRRATSACSRTPRFWLTEVSVQKLESASVLYFETVGSLFTLTHHKDGVVPSSCGCGGCPGPDAARAKPSAPHAAVFMGHCADCISRGESVWHLQRSVFSICP